jgi:hypothetical protein
MWIYLVFRNDLRSQILWETEYNYYWKDHVLQMMTGCDPETLTMEYDDVEENDKDHIIGDLIKKQKYKEAFHVATGSSFFVFMLSLLSYTKTEPCGRILSIDEAKDGLNCELWTRKEQIGAVHRVHSVLTTVSMGNCHSAVKGTGGTARPGTKVSILRDLKKAHGPGGHLLDVGCSFGHFMLSALLLGYAGVCGCDLPENKEVQCTVLTNAKAWLGISPGDLCEWIGSDVMDLILPEHLSRRITAVYSFWNGLGVAAQQQTLELCRSLVNVQSVAVYYVAKEWPTPEAGITAIQFSFLNRIPLKV